MEDYKKSTLFVEPMKLLMEVACSKERAQEIMNIVRENGKYLIHQSAEHKLTMDEFECVNIMLFSFMELALQIKEKQDREKVVM